MSEVKTDIVRLSHQVDFTEVDDEDLNGLLESHSELLSNGKLESWREHLLRRKEREKMNHNQFLVWTMINQNVFCLFDCRTRP